MSIVFLEIAKRLDGLDKTKSQEEVILNKSRSTDGSKYSTGGPDYFNFEFVKRFWNLLKEDVIVSMGEIHGTETHFCGALTLQLCSDPERKFWQKGKEGNLRAR